MPFVLLLQSGTEAFAFPLHLKQDTHVRTRLTDHLR